MGSRYEYEIRCHFLDALALVFGIRSGKWKGSMAASPMELMTGTHLDISLDSCLYHSPPMRLTVFYIMDPNSGRYKLMLANDQPR